MTHLEELQRRLQQSDRRVFGFMHPSLPGEPLVVLHTAIMDQVPDCMDAVLAQRQQQQHHTQQQHAGSSSSSEATVACFYSISSSQKGLAGVDLGNFLIKKAAQLLLAELPQLSTLVTLSPIPGFRAWLIATLRQATAAAGAVAAADQNSSSDAAQAALFSGPEIASALQLASMLPQPPSSNSSSTTTSSSSSTGSQQAAAAQAMLQLVVDNAWVLLPLRQQEQLRPLLLRLCATYLLTERRRNFALDPVAHFHLRNGAQLWRINWR